MSDLIYGKLIVISSVIILIYFSCWIFLTPFAEATDYLFKVFPSLRYALIIPAVSGLIFITIISLFVLSSIVF